MLGVLYITRDSLYVLAVYKLYYILFVVYTYAHFHYEHTIVYDSVFAVLTKPIHSAHIILYYTYIYTIYYSNKHTILYYTIG